MKAHSITWEIRLIYFLFFVVLSDFKISYVSKIMMMMLVYKCWRSVQAHTVFCACCSQWPTVDSPIFQVPLAIFILTLICFWRWFIFTHTAGMYLMVVFLFVHRERRMQVSTFSTTTWSMDRSPPKSWLSSCARGEVLFWEESSWWWGGGVRRCNWYCQECDVKFVLCF